MENFIESDIDFENNVLSDLVFELNTVFNRQQFEFAGMCYVIYGIWAYCKGNYFKAKDNEYYNSYKLLAKFGFDKKAISRYKNCYERYCIVVNKGSNRIFAMHARIKDIYATFSPSKLFELLTLPVNTTDDLINNKLITPDMTCKQIREYIKTLKYGSDKAQNVVENITINEEEIPMVYNPKQEYEYSYFETKTKNQLLNIVWELQKEYQALKLKGEKKNAKQSNN